MFRLAATLALDNASPSVRGGSFLRVDCIAARPNKPHQLDVSDLLGSDRIVFRALWSDPAAPMIATFLPGRLRREAAKLAA